jgi:hypothetical protein
MPAGFKGANTGKAGFAMIRVFSYLLDLNDKSKINKVVHLYNDK